MYAEVKVAYNKVEKWVKAQSADYIVLQNVYKSKARADLVEVTSTVRSLEQRLNRTTTIDEKEIEAFCKNAAHVKLIRGRSLPFTNLSGSVKWTGNAKSACMFSEFLNLWESN